jgi:uncharacterized protein (DUF2236 family)
MSGRGKEFTAVMARGYFRDDSPVRLIGREAVLMLGGGRALLMQAAHPLVAAGIVGHSDYELDPWRRLARTMTALYTIVFGTREEADRMGAVVRAVHVTVRGELSEDVGRWRAGAPYAADDPELQLWVHGTLLTTGIAMHETYVGPLSRRRQEGFYRDMRVVAELFGVPADVLPSTLREFRGYERAMLESGALAVGADARAVARTVLHPRAPLALLPALRALRVPAIGLLPQQIRTRYGFAWRPEHRALLASSARSARVLLPAVPTQLRMLRSSGRSGLGLRLLAAYSR